MYRGGWCSSEEQAASIFWRKGWKYWNLALDCRDEDKTIGRSLSTFGALNNYLVFPTSFMHLKATFSRAGLEQLRSAMCRQTRRWCSYRSQLGALLFSRNPNLLRWLVAMGQSSEMQVAAPTNLRCYETRARVLPVQYKYWYTTIYC